MPHLEPRRVRELLRTESRSAPTSDAELLARFAADRDEAAFAELVVRHGRLVLGTARRYLGDAHAAEDVCQATFLVLARKAGSLRWGPTIGPWLHATAVRLARKAGRWVRPAGPAEAPARGTDPAAAAAWCETCRVLDEELAALREVVRGPLVLCYLQGRTRDEAAAALGCSLTMLKRRLERGRNLLRARLARRGIGLPAVGAGVLAADLVVGPDAAGATARAAVAYVAFGKAPAAVAPLLGTRMGWAKVLVLVAGLVTIGLGLVGAAGRSDENGPAPKGATADPPVAPKITARTDRFGDALPPGVVTRLGTSRHRAAGAQVAVTTDGKSVVTAGDDLVVRVFDAVTGETRETRTLDGPYTDRTALSADGRYLAGVAYPAPGKIELLVWDLTTGKRAGRLPLGKDPATALAVHSGTTKVAFIRGPYTYPPSALTTCVWDFTAPAEPVAVCAYKPKRESYGEPRTLFSPDGEKLLAHQPDGRLLCWDVGGKKILWEKSRPYSKFFFFAPGGKTVVIEPHGVGLPGFECFSAADGTAVDGAKWDGSGTRERLSFWPVAVSPNGRLVALFQGQRRVIFYDTTKKAIVRELDDPRRVPGEENVGFWAVPTNFAFTPDGTGFVWRAPTVQRWDVATGKATWPATWDQGHTEAVTRLTFAPHGTLISSANDSTNYVWDLASGRPKYRLPKGYGDLTALTPDGWTLFTGTSVRDKPLKGWDLATGKEARTLKGDVSFPQYSSSGDREAAVTADGKRLVTLTDNPIGNDRIPPGRYLSVWDLGTGKLEREEKVDTRENATVLAPGGDVYLAVSQNDPNPRARFISTATGKELGHLAEDALTGNGSGRVTMPSVFSPGGRLVATRVINGTVTGVSVDDRPIRVWAVATARALADFPTTGPAHFAFAPDGRTLVVAGADEFRVYELATRKEVRAVAVTGVPRGRKPGPFATALAVGPGGRTVATGHDDGTVLIWDATPPRAALGPADADSAWQALADPDPKVGRAAVFRLADAPDLALRLFEERLKPAAPDPRAAALVRRLGAEEFQEREAAEKELRALGTRAGPALTAALADAPSAELRARAERLMSAVSPSAPLFGEDLRDARAVAVLEAIDSTASRQFLKRLATGAPEVQLTREAKSALGASQR